MKPFKGIWERIFLSSVKKVLMQLFTFFRGFQRSFGALCRPEKSVFELGGYGIFSMITYPF